MNRLYVVENTFTVTGTMADHRLSMPASGISAYLLALCEKVFELLRTDVSEFGDVDIKTAAGQATDMLVRTPALGRALAQTLGGRPVALMRGHGCVVVADGLPRAVFRSVYTEMNARLQAQAMALGGPVTYLDDEEARLAGGSVGGTVVRPWDLWRKKALGR